MSDVSSQKFLQLIKVSFDVSTSVVRDFTDFKVISLPEYGGSVIKFLDLRKHDLYHKWQPDTPCCHCQNVFQQLSKETDNWRFYKLYDIISDRKVVCMKTKGPVKKKGCTSQHCICNVIPKQSILLNQMDISTLLFLLRDCIITPSQLKSIQNLNYQRCRLCHAYSTRSLSTDEYDDVLHNLENSTLELAMHVSPYYHRSIKEHLAVMKSYDITPEESRKFEEMVFNEIYEMKTENSKIIRNGFKTQTTKTLEAKEEIIQNQNAQFAEIKEQIQQLEASVKVFIKQESRTSDNQGAASKEYRDETSTENLATSAESGTDTTGVDEMSSELFAKQGAKPKRLYSDASQIRATCQVEGKDIDEHSAVQSLPDTEHFDLFFGIVSAKQKCILLELEIPSKVLEDRVLFRLALRALIVKISHAGRVDINKQSTITLHLTFKDDLTEDIRKEIQGLSKHPFLCTMNTRLNYNISSYEDWIILKLAWLENENVILMAENCRLFKQLYLQSKHVSDLESDIENLRKRMLGRIAVETPHVEIERTTEEMPPFESMDEYGESMDEYGGTVSDDESEESMDDYGESMDEYGGTVSDDETEVEIGW